MIRCAAFTRTFAGALTRPMPLFPSLIPSLLSSLLLLLAGMAQAEQALQLSAELNSPASLSFRTVPQVAEPALLPDPSREVKDDLPPIPTIDLTTPPDDLWQRMRNGFSMPDLDSPLVADRQAWYLNRPDLLKRIFERSRRYLHHIVGELEKRGMPTELALLPVVGALTPLPNTSSTLAEGDSARLHAMVTMASGSFAAAVSSPCDLSKAARSLPSISRTATRSPSPSTWHHTLACTLLDVAAPLSLSVKYCSSSMRLPE